MAKRKAGLRRRQSVWAWFMALGVSLFLFALAPLMVGRQPQHPGEDRPAASLARLVISRTVPAAGPRIESPVQPFEPGPEATGVQENAVSEPEPVVKAAPPVKAVEPAKAVEQVKSTEPAELTVPQPKTKAPRKAKTSEKTGAKARSVSKPAADAKQNTGTSGRTETKGAPTMPDGEGETAIGNGSSSQEAISGQGPVGQVASRPEPVRAPRPLYPGSARRRGVEGWVRVRFLVDEQGRVRDLSVVQANPSGLFDRAVLQTLPNWRFRPGTISGRPVSTWVETTIEFKLLDG